MREDKKVTYKHLKVGQEIKGTILEGCNSWFTGIIKDINPAYVTYLMWGRDECRISSEALFLVEMPEEEFKLKYQEKAKEVLKNIQNKLNYDEIGYHEMWNSWLYGTPYEMAQACVKDEMTIVGHCTDIIPKTSWVTEDVFDIGVCAEYKDWERFWCHYSTENMNELLETYRDLRD